MTSDGSAPRRLGGNGDGLPLAPVPQLTLRAVVLSIVLAMILAAANTYLGLFAGMTIATAIPAAVVSMAVLRLLGGGSILENNIVQTGASAGSVDRRGRDLHDPGAGDPRLLERLPATRGCWRSPASAASSACCSRCRCAAR